MIQGKYNLENNGQSLSGANRNNTSIYINEGNSIDLSTLKQRIIDEKSANPNYKELREEEQKRIIEENKKLFGE